jgi:hypothetical protein
MGVEGPILGCRAVEEEEKEEEEEEEEEEEGRSGAVARQSKPLCDNTLNF